MMNASYVSLGYNEEYLRKLKWFGRKNRNKHQEESLLFFPPLEFTTHLLSHVVLIS